MMTEQVIANFVASSLAMTETLIERAGAARFEAARCNKQSEAASKRRCANARVAETGFADAVRLFDITYRNAEGHADLQHDVATAAIAALADDNATPDFNDCPREIFQGHYCGALFQRMDAWGLESDLKQKLYETALARAPSLHAAEHGYQNLELVTKLVKSAHTAISHPGYEQEAGVLVGHRDEVIAVAKAFSQKYVEAPSWIVGRAKQDLDHNIRWLDGRRDECIQESLHLKPLPEPSPGDRSPRFVAGPACGSA